MEVWSAVESEVAVCCRLRLYVFEVTVLNEIIAELVIKRELEIELVKKRERIRELV